MKRIRKTLYLDPEEEKELRDEAHEARISESELLRHYLKMLYGIKPNYCNRPGVRNCKECSLSNYNRDCRNNPIKKEKEDNLMTAREFIESLKEKPAWEDLQLGKGLFELTEFLGDETQVDYKQFPDADLPGEAFEDPEFEFKFEQFLEGRT